MLVDFQSIERSETETPPTRVRVFHQGTAEGVAVGFFSLS